MKDIRQRMIEDMKLRGLTPSTQATYLEAVKVLARHYNRRLDEITQEQVRDFLLYLIESKGYAKSTYKVYMYAIKFLYQNTLGRQWRFLTLARVSPERKLPIILSRGEVWSLLDLVRRDKPRMSLTLMYTCGLRVSEAVHLRLQDIDSQRMVVWVRKGKGGKDRSVPLPSYTLAQLRAEHLSHHQKLRATLPDGNPPAVSHTQERKLPHVTAFVCHPSFGGWCSSAHDSIAAGS